MFSHFTSLAIELTPFVVLTVGLLIALVLAFYWHSVRRYSAQRWPSRLMDDPEHMLLAGLLLIAVAVIVAFIALTVGLTLLGSATLPVAEAVFG